MNINIAKPCDLIEVMYLVKACSIELNSAASYYSNYFNPQISELIDKGFLYKSVDNESTVGILAVNVIYNEQYTKINWEYTSGNVLSIFILVHPLWRKYEIGKDLLDIAEKYALENKFQSIRLDVFANNGIALNILNKAQYKKAGEIYLPFQTASFVCFEKQL